MNHRIPRLAAIALGLMLSLLVGPAAAQQILLDKSVKAGELTLFPELGNESVFYYVPDKARLATDANGTPQFSFLRYVENVRSGADQPEAREGEGGGIVHALVTLSVTPDQIREAQAELQRVRPGGIIKGAVMFKSGRFGLVSSFADPKGNLTQQVVGLGNAPLLDGEKAAVSIQLTKLGAKILWESFNMAAPDVSFRFEMDMTGFRSPKRATIEADWSKVYSHRSFGAGIATSYLAAEVKSAFDELRTQDAIKISQVGEDDKMDAIVQTAYKLVQDRMFEPFGGTGTPDVTAIAGGAQGQQSLLDRATTRLKEAAADVKAANADIRKDNDAARARNDKARTEQGKAAGERSRAESAEIAARMAEEEAAGAQKRAASTAARLAELEASAGASGRATKPTPTGAVTADGKGAQDGVTTGDAGTTAPITTTDSTTSSRTTGGLDMARALAGGDFDDEAVVSPQMIAQARKRADAARVEAEAAKTKAATLRKDANALNASADQSATASAPTENLKQEQAAPTLSVIATLEMKKVKQSGTFRFDMNKTLPDNVTLAFSENIGDLRRLKSDRTHFREVNLDDPLFKQRELVAVLDVANAQDFGQFVNFVNVQMRKKHAGGEQSDDEVRVDRVNFNKEGNNFKLMYGWKGDNDRRKWMEYEFQSTWSLIGGRTIVEPWKTSTSGAISLSPPYRRRTVSLDGSVESLTQSEVRAVTVQVFFDVAGAEQSRQITLNVLKGQVADKLEILSPPNATSYDYQITWQLKGNRTLSTPRQSTVSDVLYVDDLPAR